MHAIHNYAKANNKYVKNHDKNIILSYSENLDANNLYVFSMFQKLPGNGCKWKKALINLMKIS